jgi:small subunit ribosomal protein S6
MKNAENKYELMVIIDSEIGQDAVKKRLTALKKQLNEHGEVFFEDIWGEKTLGYPMKKKTKGDYAVFNFSFDPAEIKELEMSLKLDNEVIRHLLVKTPFKYEPKSLADIEKATAEAKEAEAAEKEAKKQ